MLGRQRVGWVGATQLFENSVRSMELVHYSAKPLKGELHSVPQNRGEEMDYFKPRGLWVSDDSAEVNWRSWCESESFGLDRLVWAHDVELATGANVLVINSTDGIRRFTREFAVHPIPALKSNMFIDWAAVRARWDGMIITPYIYEMRFSYGEDDAMWYYSWDCASGCIWEPKAIQSITLRAGRD